MYDVVIIGAGVSGCAVARELSRYNAKVCVLEKAFEVCEGTSKANSGIAHSGYDARPGTLKAKLNIEGIKMLPQLSKDLEISFEQCGSFVVCTEEDGLEKLEELYQRGLQNGIEGLEIIRDKARIKEMEPNITDDVIAVLYAPTAGIVCPFGMTMAFAENANANGVEFKFKTEVKNIKKSAENWIIETNNGNYETKCVVNAAGVYADVFHNMVSENKINITARRGQYLLFDRNAGKHVNQVIFALPTKLGKGVLVARTVHGNLLAGPTAEDVDDKENTRTTSEGLNNLLTKSTINVKNLPLEQVITTFSGLRAHEDGGDFIIKEVEDALGFFDCAGIESPGLTSAPAIGKMLAEMIKDKLSLEAKDNFIPTRKAVMLSNTLPKEERAKLIKEKPAYGNIVCRCEMVSEGDILDAIHRPLGASTLDGVKRRTRACSGRCQAGFCGPKVMEIINRELGIPMEEITKFGGKSTLVIGKSKYNI